MISNKKTPFSRCIASFFGIERKEPFLIVAFKDENNSNTAQFRILTHRMALKNARGYEVDTLHFARDKADLESHLSFKPCSKVMEDGTTKTMWQHFWLSDSRELCVHVESCK